MLMGNKQPFWKEKRQFSLALQERWEEMGLFPQVFKKSDQKEGKQLFKLKNNINQVINGCSLIM